MDRYLGIDCGSVSLNLVLLTESSDRPISVYLRTGGRPLHTFVQALDEMISLCGGDVEVTSALVTGSGRDLLSRELAVPAVNEITAHSVGVRRVNPDVRTIIEIGGQDSKFIRIAPPIKGDLPIVPVFRMNEICAAGTGAFLDEQVERLGIPVEDFGPTAMLSRAPAPIAGRCAVFAKTDMIHQAQEGASIPDILSGLAFSLVRNYIATLIKGDVLEPLVSLQGGVMSNQAVVHAFRQLLNLEPDQIVVPPHHAVLGALGCAVLAGKRRSMRTPSLESLKRSALGALELPYAGSGLSPLPPTKPRTAPGPVPAPRTSAPEPPLVIGLDVGSVSVKGVVVDGSGAILEQDYRLSGSRPLETLKQVLGALTAHVPKPDFFAVTGSGRELAGRLIEADLIVNEITAQATAALLYDPEVGTVVEIGGQDSKWIAFEDGRVIDFEMNRVCAAGTGSFLMAQAGKLDFASEDEFSRAAFRSRSPVDLGSRCTVFMQSDLVHHQNNGASTEDLAAGVCMGIVRNYLEKVASNRPIGDRVLFLGGVATSPAVTAAFESEFGREFRSPDFFRVSGAFGAALKTLEEYGDGRLSPKRRKEAVTLPSEIKSDRFNCRGCPNRCRIGRYQVSGRTVYNGGLCDRWETGVIAEAPPLVDPLSLRFQLPAEAATGPCGNGIS
ncbi:MAG: acyl-CoA dehydratase activase, partial [Pseudomonadota bacterium]